VQRKEYSLVNQDGGFPVIHDFRGQPQAEIAVRDADQRFNGVDGFPKN
jgi:hypothetical protein